MWTRVPVAHGIFGFLLLFGGVGLMGLAALRRSAYALPAALFLLLFVMSIYQRPVVWMPYALTVLICGPTLTGRDHPLLALFRLHVFKELARA